MKSIEGQLVVAQGARFAIVASRWNAFVVDRMVEGAVDAIVRHGGDLENITVVRVPGSWELPMAVARLADRKRFDAIVALGAVIRGQTLHHEHIAGEACKGLGAIALQSGVPVALGVITTETVEQAIDRAGAKMGNKGWEAAVSAIEMVSLLAVLDRLDASASSESSTRPR